MVVRDTFAEDRAPVVLALLREYGTEEWHCEPDRVRRAIVKLGQGDVDQIRHYLNVAKIDYRDVLYYSGDY
ncbi:hypothetical protein FRAAL3256 [Frankia alni ACN14a]|uniref:Uncharacterized protein n=1 Tax=Frankia alni (strain DSM 45986 / CECT 9034 / ACN14a) TaxID=326424 RepID=Q0RKQ5_FRAAA|nr:hypothetical protein FRAAL3256 [Frankia alni ACN14a]